MPAKEIDLFEGFVSLDGGGGEVVSKPAPKAAGLGKEPKEGDSADAKEEAVEAGEEGEEIESVESNEGAEAAQGDSGAGAEASEAEGAAGNLPEGDDGKLALTEPKPKKEGLSAKERVQQLARKSRAAEERAEAAEARAVAAEARAQAAEAAKEALTREEVKVNDAGKDRPDPSDQTKYKFGEIDSKYLSDVVAYDVKKAIAAAKAEEEASRRAVAETTRQSKIRQKASAVIEAGRAAYEDFDAVVLASPIIAKELTQVVHDLLVGSEVGVQAAHYLATHPVEARKVFDGTPIEQAARFGRLEASLLSRQKAAALKAKQPKLPEPVSQPRGNGGKLVKSAEDATFTEFEAMYREELRRSGS